MVSKKQLGNRIAYINEKGQLHREDGPAVEWNNGTKFWYLNDKCHREDGPAREYPDGHKEWYINGQRHREDGPAVEYRNGSKDWWINGKIYSEQQWQQEVINIKLDRLKNYVN